MTTSLKVGYGTKTPLAKSVNIFTSVAEKKCTLMYLIPEDNLRAMMLIIGQVEASSNGLETQIVVIGTVKCLVIDIDHVTTRVSVSDVVICEDEGREVPQHLLRNKDRGRRKGDAATHAPPAVGALSLEPLEKKREEERRQ